MNGPLDIHPKVVGSSVSGALTVCILYIIGHYGKVTLPAEVGGALTILIATACGWLAPSTPKTAAVQQAKLATPKHHVVAPKV